MPDRVHGGVPDLPSQLVDRPRLLTQLDAIATRQATVICAPAGTGKTVLLALWCRTRAESAVTWLVPSGPDELLRELFEVLGAAAPADGAAEPVISRLSGATRDRLSEAAAAAGRRVIVVDALDTPDLAAAAFEVVELFVEQAPELRLVLAGRCPPPPDLVPLLMTGRVWQVGARDLTLSPQEVGDVIRASARRPVQLADLASIAERLDGWMAGAVLAGLLHPGGAATADDLHQAAMEGIESYVSTTVIRGLAADLRRFAVATSCVEDLDRSLCDAIVGRDDSDLQLARLRAVGFPIVRVPSDGSRYLRPVREALDAIARREDPAAHAAALRAAADWYSRNQMPFEAARCLVRLDAWHDVVTVITHHVPLILQRDEFGRLADLVRLAPREIIREQTALALAGAWVLRMDGRVTAANELLGVYWPYMTERGRMIADVSRASVASWTDDMQAAVSFADAALAACDHLGDEAFDAVESPFPPAFGPATTDVYRALAHGAAQLACAYGGLWEQGSAHLVDVGRRTAAMMPQTQALSLYGQRATYDVLSGRPADGEIAAYAGLTVAEQGDLLENRAAADAWFALGEARRLTLRHAEAVEPLRKARELAELNRRRNLRAACVAAEAHLAIDGGNPDEALAAIHRLRTDSPHRAPRTIAGQLAAAEARAYAAEGRFQAGRRALDGAPLTPPVASARVILLLGAGDIPAAQQTIRDWPSEPTPDSVVRRAFAAAVISDQSGDRQRDRLVRTALAAAATPRLLQPFVEFGFATARLLRLAAIDDSPLVAELQGWLEHTASVRPLLQFTARELTVMSHVADGRTLREVAAAIHVSVNTVRTHVQTVYRKLGVDNRSDAIRLWKSFNGRDAAADLRTTAQG